MRNFVKYFICVLFILLIGCSAKEEPEQQTVEEPEQQTVEEPEQQTVEEPVKKEETEVKIENISEKVIELEKILKEKEAQILSSQKVIQEKDYLIQSLQNQLSEQEKQLTKLQNELAQPRETYTTTITENGKTTSSETKTNKPETESVEKKEHEITVINIENQKARTVVTGVLSNIGSKTMRRIELFAIFKDQDGKTYYTKAFKPEQIQLKPKEKTSFQVEVILNEKITDVEIVVSSYE